MEKIALADRVGAADCPRALTVALVSSVAVGRTLAAADFRWWAARG
jgi:hypothetical protein